jgi:positive regulator of sigma E activity
MISVDDFEGNRERRLGNGAWVKIGLSEMHNVIAQLNGAVFCFFLFAVYDRRVEKSTKNDRIERIS